MPRRTKKQESDSDSEYNDNSSNEPDVSISYTSTVATPPNKRKKSTPEREKKLKAPPSYSGERRVDEHGNPVAIGKRQKKRKRKTYDEPEFALPASARKTEKGGYSHTNRSKLAISKANAGNTPWNKGRNRSSEDKAKIAIGVRARNRAILMEKLKRLGMTEEEWLIKKKEIKYLRERIRRAKRGNEKHLAKEAEAKLKTALSETTDAEVDKKLAASKSKKLIKGAPKVDVDVESKESFESEVRVHNLEPAGEGRQQQGADDVFGRDIVWTSSEFSDDGKSYEKSCPTGGPGGLVCCEHCSNLYSRYLSSAVKDMETQRIHRTGTEIKELMGFLNQGRQSLQRAQEVARTKVPPPPPVGFNSAEPPRRSQAAKKTSNEAATPVEWNVTSTIDVAEVRNGKMV